MQKIPHDTFLLQQVVSLVNVVMHLRKAIYALEFEKGPGKRNEEAREALKQADDALDAAIESLADAVKSWNES